MTSTGPRPPDGPSLYPSRLKILDRLGQLRRGRGRRAVEAAAVEAVEELRLDAVVCRTGCIGFCAQSRCWTWCCPTARA